MRVNPFKTLRIDLVFFFGFAFIVTLLVCVIVFFSYINGSKEIADNTSYYQQKLLIELHKKLNTNLVDIEQTSNTAAQNFSDLYEEVFDGTDYDKVKGQTSIRSQLNNYVYGMPILQSVHVYSDLAPNSVQDYVKFMSLEQLEKEDWYKELRNSDYTWLRERLIKTNNGEVSVISFARKVYNRFNRSVAVMVFNVQVPAFKALIATEDNRSNLALLDDTGKLITTSGDPGFFLQHDAEIQTQLDSQTNGAKRTGDEFLVWSSSLDSRWSLVEITSWSRITAGSLKQTQIILALGIATIILILLLAVFLSRQFVKPIGLLLKAMSNFSLSKRTPLPEDYKNEFGRLFQGYDKLTCRIEELYENLEEQYERQRAAEIKALQMMINPHFLYNSLDQVNWMAIEASQPQISSMLAHLGQFFRLALSNSESLVPLSEELAHIDSYLQFQKIRWEERLDYRYLLEEETKNLFVPKIILQPFVENAFIHGFHGKRQASLTISAGIIGDDRLQIIVSDNGRQLQENWKEKQSAKGGYGLRNVRERITALFGDKYGFMLDNSPEGGTQAVISLPIVNSKSLKGGLKHVEGGNH
ncbi:sensor with HAMP domain protein [Paenibacillus sp. FSL R7-0273]|uniref:cache domain-containing sensor histidine kinase n=1 Tax=Paenibacillus sp. FSL R7-0273 TaxID=1536772 RepID=UPI0004F80212|nr:sensor histidine kinase [Paenibacillus sp. FSL R7-0273]AIQ48837.1 sensor with HAMP domain protein [Paenibacillus sp. FSL R7-0273]OMF91284.1 sensor with HAMP domain protein [Paenibacillus sp. FSL R7-0273]